MKRKRLIWASVFTVALAALVGYDLLHERGVREEFAIAEEFELKPIIELPTIGPFDLSVTKAVVYLWITAAVLIVFSLLVRRSLKREPGRFRVLVEMLYGLAHDGIVGAVMKSGRATWFPFIAGVFFFVLTANLIGLIPLPLAEHHQFGFYTATANLYVTLALALCTFVFTHYAGIRQNGGLHYFKNWAPPSAPPVLKQLIWVIHAVSEVFRLVSLAVRLFANMLAGHAILAVFFAMALIFQSYLAALVLQGASVLIYLFEIFVAFIQAFIFAILSAVYIAGALDQEH
jgi:F-type H+-transporting ATPase subunit a